MRVSRSVHGSSQSSHQTSFYLNSRVSALRCEATQFAAAATNWNDRSIGRFGLSDWTHTVNQMK